MGAITLRSHDADFISVYYVSFYLIFYVKLRRTNSTCFSASSKYNSDWNYFPNLSCLSILVNFCSLLCNSSIIFKRMPSLRLESIELVIALLTVISLILILIDIFFPLDAEHKQFVYIFDLVVVLILAADFALRVGRSAKKGRYVMNQWYEIPAMIPIILYASADTSTIAGQVLQQFRVIAFFRLVRLYYILTLIQGSRFVLLSAFSIITIVFGALGVYLTEAGNPEANIRNLSDAFWWAVETVSTVGYGDVYPVTAEGRIVGIFVMFAGIGILATFITALGSKLIELKLNESKRAKKAEPLPHDFSTKTKEMIKTQIDKVETLDRNDFDALISMLTSIRQHYSVK
jgi:voltage-gated potassium channel